LLKASECRLSSIASHRTHRKPASPVRDRHFARSRARVTSEYARPDDFQAAARRIDAMAYGGTLKQPVLVSLLREGKGSRTAFKIALAHLTDMDVELIERVVENHDIDTLVLLPRAAELLKLMPHTTPPDMSRFLLSPMPGLLVEVAVKPGQKVQAGERVAVIEAMKMENVLFATQDGVVKSVVANKGESLTVDQMIVEFE
jgi:acetyl/propionyl-CoA carboxylase alpha subunit